MRWKYVHTSLLCCVIFGAGFVAYRGQQTLLNQIQSLLLAQQGRLRESLSTRSIWNTHRITYDAGLRTEFESLLRESAHSDDPQLVRFVATLLDPPSRHATRKLVHTLFQTPQAKAVDELYKGQTNLFYVEAGALDGERSSNTAWLEASRQWEGLLVEVDPYFYTQLRGKSRAAYSINGCISGSIQKLPFHECSSNPNGGCGRLGSKNSSGHKGIDVPCFSLQTLMLALNRTTIDYFSLDVEGHEYQVLDTIPWDKINVRAITVEFNGNTETDRKVAKAKLKDYMKKRGYTDAGIFEQTNVVRDLYSRDILFVRDHQ